MEAHAAHIPVGALETPEASKEGKEEG